MGEEKKAGKDAGGGGEKKKDAGAAAAAPEPIVLKVDLHCAGCASKVRKAIKHAPGAYALWIAARRLHTYAVLFLLRRGGSFLVLTVRRSFVRLLSVAARVCVQVWRR